jgi:hypothetical protein
MKSSVELKEIAALKKESRIKAARTRRNLTRLLCGTFLALAALATFAALPREQAAPVILSAQAATLALPQADEAATAEPKPRTPRRSSPVRRRASRRHPQMSASWRVRCDTSRVSLHTYSLHFSGGKNFTLSSVPPVPAGQQPACGCACPPAVAQK